MKLIALLLSSSLLAACGGGSGGGAGTPASAAPVASTSIFLLKQAYSNDFLDTKPYSMTIGGTVTITSGSPPVPVTGTITGSGSVSQSTIAPATFDGAAAQSKSKTPSGSIVVTVNSASGSQALPSTPTTQFVSNVFDLLGFTSPASLVSGVAIPASFLAAAAPLSIPVSAKVGDSGQVGVINSYASAAKAAILGTTTITYALEADTATTAIMRFTQTNRNLAGATLSTQSDTYRITPAGAVTRLKQESQVKAVDGSTTLEQTLVLTY